jgi:glucokinase
MDSYTIGIDLGGTNLRIAAYAAGAASDAASNQQFLARVDLPTRVDAGPASVVKEMAEAIRGLADGLSNMALSGVGLGTPGPLELPAGILHGLPNFPGWDRFELRKELEAALAGAGVSCPVYVESDANVAALAECVLGAGSTYGADSLCMLTLGTGVGNAIILNGAIFSGAHGMAGEAGHLTIWPDGLACNCGNSGCLEAYASATAVRRMAEDAADSGFAPGLKSWRESTGPLGAQAVFQLAAQGDRDALRIFNTTGIALGIALASLVNTLDLRLYVVGGGLAGAWEFFSPAMFRELTARSYVFRLVNERLPGRRIEIVPAVLGSDSGLLGAALLALGTHSRGTEI